MDYRLDLAAKQLSETTLKVIDIAENCGFLNHSYFTMAFQKKYRKTPLAYRADAHRERQRTSPVLQEIKPYPKCVKIFSILRRI